MENEDNKAYLAGALVIVFIVCSFLLASAFAARAATCSEETSEQRITEIITPADKVDILDGDRLSLFVKNANDLYNIGWVRDEIVKIYAIEAAMKADNPHFQAVHLFFIGRDGCIAYYETIYKALLDVLLSEKPCEALGITCAE